MKNLILLLLFISNALLFGQTFKVENTTGNVKVLNGVDSNWLILKTGMEVSSNSIISTDKNSSVKLKGDDVLFTLKESSAIAVSNIKKMNLNELLLALALDDVINTPRKKNNNKSENTAVYGTKESAQNNPIVSSESFGEKRLNGARQLAENNMKESAIITAKEIFRKYPETKKNVNQRLYFADLLFEKGLYDEAYEEYKEIANLSLTNDHEKEINKKIEQVEKKLLTK